jgi:hypothetical protein
MKNEKSFKKILILLGIVFVGFFVVYYLVYQDIKVKNEHISTLAQDLDFQSSRQEYLISTQRMIQNISSDIDRINNSIVAVDGDVQFIENLESIAKNEGLSISIDSLLIEDDPSFSNNEITTLKVKAKAEGSWAGTYSFLAQIESLPFKVKINKFSIVNDADGGGIDGQKTFSLNWQSSFEIQVLKYK